MWTEFYDMSSGGMEKTEWTKIYIELPRKEAEAYFEEVFGSDPNNVTCSCCGADYAIYEQSDEPEEHKDHRIIRKSEIQIITPAC